MEKIDKDYKRTVYVDMDGVLANFEEHFYKISKGKHIDSVSPKELWNTIETYGKYNFFSELPLMSEALEMWDFAVNNFLKVKILSSLGRPDKQTAQGKLVWLRHNIPSLQMDDIILVDNKHKKQHYSNYNSIIIDDTLVVIQEWVKKGGIGILHKSSSETIIKLKQYV